MELHLIMLTAEVEGILLDLTPTLKSYCNNVLALTPFPFLSKFILRQLNCNCCHKLLSAAIKEFKFIYLTKYFLHPEMGNMHKKKSILYTIYRFSQIFAQTIQYAYTSRILENIQYTFAPKSTFNILSEYTLKNY